MPVHPMRDIFLYNADNMKQKILFYSHDTFGLGHISRILAVGRRVAGTKNVSILLVTGSGIIHGLRIPKGIDYVKLPSVTKVGDDVYRSKYLSLPLGEIISMRERILFETTTLFEPDIFVVDNVPLGLKKEARKTLDALRSGRPGCRIILTMRDVLDNPVKIRRSWGQNGVYRVLNDYFDKVLVFGLREICDVVKEYRIPEPAASKFKFCGYIDRKETVRPPERIRNGLDINGHRFILVTAGGGGDGSAPAAAAGRV